MTVGRDRKISCPFHADQHRSLHVYPTAAEGRHCFSCRRGGFVYDLAAELWGTEPRAPDSCDCATCCTRSCSGGRR